MPRQRYYVISVIDCLMFRVWMTSTCGLPVDGRLATVTTTAISMVDSSASVPFYMREESDDDDSYSDDEPTTESGNQATESGDSGKVKGKGQQAGGEQTKEKQAKKRGNVRAVESQSWRSKGRSQYR